MEENFAYITSFIFYLFIFLQWRKYKTNRKLQKTLNNINKTLECIHKILHRAENAAPPILYTDEIELETYEQYANRVSPKRGGRVN